MILGLRPTKSDLNQPVSAFMGKSKKRSQATEDAVYEALNAFDSEIYEPRHKQATNEASTKRYLIEPFLLRVLEIDTRRPDHALMEVKAEGYKGGAADFVLLLNGSYWCVVEANKLGALAQGSRDILWEQLSHYANSATFREVNYFVLTDGRRWVWYKREPNNYLPETPFLEHDVTSPSSEVLTWCRAVKDLASVDDLASAATRVRFTSALQQWLNGLKNPTDLTLESILGDEIFANLRGKGKRNLVRARNELRSVWDSTFKDFLGKTDSPPPLREISGYAWRLGRDSDWNSCETGVELMVAVVQALANRNPDGAAVWYSAVTDRWPNWFKRPDAPPPYRSWDGKDLEGGYTVRVSLNNEVKDRRLRSLAEDIRARTGLDPELEMQWPKPQKLNIKSASNQKVAVSVEKPSRMHPRKQACQWRLGKQSAWITCKSGRDLLAAATRGLAVLCPTGPADWYQAIAARKPHWIIRAGTPRPFESWAERDLGEGYLIHVGTSNTEKGKRLRYFTEDIRARTGVDPQLELRWNVGSRVETDS